MCRISWSKKALKKESQNFTIIGNEICRETQHRDWTEEDDLEFNLIKDFYYPFVRQKIDENAQMKVINEQEKSECVLHLEELDRRHENLMIAKKFLWDEIDRGSKFLQQNCKNNYYFDQYLTCFLKIFGEQKCCQYYSEYVDQLINKLQYYDNKKCRDICLSWKDFENDITCKCGTSSSVPYIEYVLNPYWWKFIYHFRNNKFGHIGTKIWMLFLVGFFVCDYEYFLNNIKQLDIDNTNEFLKLIKLNLEPINNWTFTKQGELQTNMLNLCYYTLSTKIPSVFDEKVKIVTDALNAIPNFKKRYITDNANGCFATMTCSGSKYYTLSGIENKETINWWNSLVSFVDSLESFGYTQVFLDANTRYYYGKTHYISYKLYTDNETKCKEIENSNKISRMFSCCEKKMLSELFENRYKIKYTMYVKLQPCPMCERAIKAYDCGEKPGEESHIFYPKNARESKKLAIGEYDIIAKEILKISAGC